MKLCCSTAAFGHAIDSGELTQLEWIDACSNDLDVDGVEFDGRYFPRTDDDYLAQLKKLCADRCLTVACVRSPVALSGADVDASIASFLPWVAHASALGSPLLRFSSADAPDGSPGIAWRELIRGLKTVCVDAKSANITLALERGEDGSLIASSADIKRAQKECDSAWLRIATRAEDLVGAESGAYLALIDETMILTAASGDRPLVDAALRSGYRGFVSMLGAGDRSDVGALKAVISAWCEPADIATVKP
jgi:hypothetical protein